MMDAAKIAELRMCAADPGADKFGVVLRKSELLALLEAAERAATAREDAIRECAAIITARADELHALRKGSDIDGTFLKERENECDVLEDAIIALIKKSKEPTT